MKAFLFVFVLFLTAVAFPLSYGVGYMGTSYMSEGYGLHPAACLTLLILFYVCYLLLVFKTYELLVGGE